jgi:lipoprotein-anchoring transpeptidase ErfK/SrfK
MARNFPEGERMTTTPAPLRWALGPILVLAAALLFQPAAAQDGALASADTKLPQPQAFAPGLHVVVSLKDRTLWLNDGETLLHTAPVGVGKPLILEYEGRTWDFRTPRGRRTIIAKQQDPVWIPPDWHYIEFAALMGLEIVWLDRNTPVLLSDSSRVVIYKNRVGRLTAENVFQPVPPGGEAVFEGKLFVPPTGTENRTIAGALGRFKLDIGNGYYLHGTPDASSVGEAESHGCLRLADSDLEYLFRRVPVGTPIFIY